LKERSFERVGDIKTIPFKARIIVSTKRDLGQLVKEGKFNEELYYLLKVFMIEIPPLRYRKDAIPQLVVHFINKINKEQSKKIERIPYEIIEKLMRYNWPGNIRELENILYQMVVLSNNELLENKDIPIEENNIHSDNQDRSNLSLHEIEREHINLVLRKVHNNSFEAARILGISVETLSRISGFN
jgi:DNA-binding NtrC family response regulator